LLNGEAMKKSILYSATVALLGVSLFAAESQAVPSGGGGGGGGGACFTCSCSITGTVGGQSCYCPSTSNGGSGCKFYWVPGFGTECYVLLGPCKAAVFGFAP
jgi:hypothetical protein